jgi:ABC-type Mn2+/Zn2+ transport system ATPase subunit
VINNQLTSQPTTEVKTGPAVQFNNVSVTFPEAVGLEDVSFEVAPGDFLAVIGPNGSGKTTLLRTILGLAKPAHGTVTVLGTGPAQARRHIGYVPQRTPFDPKFPVSVFDVALMGTYGNLGILHAPSQRDKGRVMGMLEAVGLADVASHVAGHLSGGQQQRLLIARALVQQPQLLLLDEPTSGVDVANQKSIVELIRGLHDKLKLTTLFVTHDINEVMPCLDKVLYLNRRVYAFGTCQDILNRRTLEELYQSPVLIVEQEGRPYVIVSDRHV